MNYFLFPRDFKYVRPQKRIIKEYLALSMPLFLPTILELSTANIGVFIFLIYHDQSLLAIFFVFQTLYPIINMLPDAFGNIIFSTCAKYKELEEKKKLNSVLHQIEKYLLIINSCPLILILLFGDFYISIIFPSYYSRGWLFLIIYFIQLLIFALNVPLAYELLGLREFKIINEYSLIHFALALVSWFIFIPAFSLVGIGVGLLIGEISYGIYIRYKMQKLVGLKFQAKIMVQNIFSISISLLFFISRLFFNLNLVIVLLISTIALIVYFFMLFFLKVLKREDLHILFSVLKFKDLSRIGINKRNFSSEKQSIQ
jgi:O-antigen/teichoic acid export membrane protein